MSMKCENWLNNCHEYNMKSKLPLWSTSLQSAPSSNLWYRTQRSPTYIWEGEQTTTKEKKETGVSYMLSRDKQICSALNECNQCPIKKHIKTFISFISKIYSLISAQFQFPSYIHFTSIWVVFDNHALTHTKNHILSLKSCRYFCRTPHQKVPVRHNLAINLPDS